jgi:hypothetical protein
MNERQHTITMLAQLLQNATRASITRGAIYDSGEKIVPPEEAWELVATYLIGLAEGAAARKKGSGRDVVGT